MPSLTEKDIRFKTLLIIGIYLVCQVVADISAVKTVRVGSLTLQGGVFIYALTFTLIDLLNDHLGKKAARKVVVVAGINNILMVAYFWFVAELPWVAGVPQQAFETVLLGVPRIVLASILAELVSELIDVEVFHFWKKKIKKLRWLRVILSNAVSTGVDSALFVTAAFLGTGVPIWASIKGQYIFKMIVALVSIPLIYLVKPKEKTL